MTEWWPTTACNIKEGFRFRFTFPLLSEVLKDERPKALLKYQGNLELRSCRPSVAENRRKTGKFSHKLAHNLNYLLSRRHELHFPWVMKNLCCLSHQCLLRSDFRLNLLQERQWLIFRCSTEKKTRCLFFFLRGIQKWLYEKTSSCLMANKSVQDLKRSLKTSVHILTSIKSDKSWM